MTGNGDADGGEPFDDLELDEDDILGTRTFEDALYSVDEADRKVPVDALTGEKSRPISPVAKARRFAEETTRDGGYPRVAVTRRTESMAETGGKPYISTVFFDSKVVRGRVVGRDDFGMPEYENDGRALEKAYRAAAIDSENHAVVMEEADYESGTVTITTRRTD